MWNLLYGVEITKIIFVRSIHKNPLSLTNPQNWENIIKNVSMVRCNFLEGSVVKLSYVLVKCKQNASLD